MKRKVALSLVGIVTAVGAAIALAATAVRPGKPVIVCLFASSGARSCLDSAGQGDVKWHPGHYIRVGAVAMTTSETERYQGYERIRNEPLFKGASVGITWGQIETRPGVYDFSAIDAELNYLKAMGKRTIVEIWATNYWHAIPATPQRGGRFLPDYLIDDGLVVPVREGGYSVAWSNPRVMDRFIPLARALCARYNDEPYLEQFVFGETAIDGAREFTRLIEPAATACSKTTTVLHMNYVDTPELARELVALGARHGMGVGGPDILPPRPTSPFGEDHGSLVLRGAGMAETAGYWGDYGSIDYRGVVPVSYQYQGIHNISPAQLIDYALNTQRVTHLTWTSMDHLTPEMNWSTGVLPTVRAQSATVATACPTTYRGRCSPN